MTSIDRRQVISRLTASAFSTLPLIVSSQAAKTKAVSKLSTKLRIVIPANPGGGWDQTGRALGAALVSSGLVDEAEYENKGGKGGTLGLAYYVEKYNNDSNTFLIGGSVMVGALVLQKLAVDMSAIRPLARLTSDFLVMVVAAKSPYKTLADLTASMKTNLKGIPVAGGSSGGIDHIFAGAFARSVGANPEELNYLPFTSGVDVVSAVISGKAAVGISGYSEFSTQLANGQLLAVGVSSRKSSYGIPSIRDQGVLLEISNWRGVLTGKGVSESRQLEMVQALRLATQHEGWKATLKQNHWEAAWLSGNDLNSLIDLDLTTVRVMAHTLKLKA
jgi:putative tricarboxylic transport membrane protein